MMNSFLAAGEVVPTRKAGLLAPGSSSRRAFPGSLRSQWLALRRSSPVTATGSRRIHTGFPTPSATLVWRFYLARRRCVKRTSRLTPRAAGDTDARTRCPRRGPKREGRENRPRSRHCDGEVRSSDATREQAPGRLGTGARPLSQETCRVIGTAVPLSAEGVTRCRQGSFGPRASRSLAILARASPYGVAGELSRVRRRSVGVRDRDRRARLRRSLRDRRGAARPGARRARAPLRRARLVQHRVDPRLEGRAGAGAASTACG